MNALCSHNAPFAFFARSIDVLSTRLRVGQQIARAALAYAQRSKLEIGQLLQSNHRECAIDAQAELDFVRLAHAKNIDVRTNIQFPSSFFEMANNGGSVIVRENFEPSRAAAALSCAPENKFEVAAMCTGAGKTLLQIVHALDLIRLHGARDNGPSVLVAIPNVAGRENFLSYFGVVNNGTFAPFEQDEQLDHCALVQWLGLSREQAKELCARVFFFNGVNAHEREAFAHAWIVVGYVGTLAAAQQHLVDVPFALFDEGDVGTMGHRSVLASVRGSAVNGRRSGGDFGDAPLMVANDDDSSVHRPWRNLLVSPQRILCVLYSATLRNSRSDELPPPRVRVTYAHCLEAGDVKQIALNVLCRPANHYRIGFTREERNRLLRDDQALFEMLVMAFQVYAKERAESGARSSVTVAPSTIVPLARVLGELGQVIVFAPTSFAAFEQTLRMAKLAAQRAGLCLADAVSGIHTELAARDNAATLDRFNSGTLRVLVVVDMLGRSYDNKHVDCVVHVRPASQGSYESFMQRTGRALRVLRRQDCRNETEQQLFDQNQLDCGAQQACVILLDINNPEPLIDRLLCAESLHRDQVPRADVWLQSDGSLQRIEDPHQRAQRWTQQQEEEGSNEASAPRNVFSMLDRVRSHQTLVVRCPYQYDQQFGWFVSIGQSLRALHMSRYVIKVESFDRDGRSLNVQVSKPVYANDLDAAWTMSDNRLLRQHGWVRVDAVPGATSLAVRLCKEGDVVVEKDAVPISFDARMPLLPNNDQFTSPAPVNNDDAMTLDESVGRRRIRPIDVDEQQQNRRRRVLDALAIDTDSSEDDEEEEESSSSGEENENSDDDLSVDEDVDSPQLFFHRPVDDDDDDDDDVVDSDSECSIDADHLSSIAGNVETSQISVISSDLCLVQTRDVDPDRYGLFRAHS